MFLTPRTSSTWRLAPSPRWWPVNCHSGHALVSQPNGAARDQETKRKARPSCQAVLDRFDEQYSQELGDLWESARAVLLDPGSWQYGVMLNRFSIVTGISQILQSQGFSTLLPQTRGPAVLPSGPAAVSRSKCRAGKGSLLPPGHISKWPPNDSYLQPDIKSPARDQDLESEPSPGLSRPSLQCYIHPRPLRFPSQAHRLGQLKQYFLLNAASLLPVLALKVQDGEKVLDLCSAPGGKAVAILQCATPALLCCNEPDPQRRDWLAKTLESFLSQSLTSRVIVSAQDGRSFGQSEAGTYDKVLVDSPCSNDRSWLYCGGQQGEQRLKERAGLPALQAQLLRSALSAVRPGGVVVYSTCTLSSFENFAVVETVLNDCPEAEPEDLWEEIGIPLSEHFTFRTTHPGGSQTPHNASLQPHNAPSSSYRHRLGLLVVPQPGKTWGPMFLSRIRRRK
uniref:NOP2/Sun RNA methyltransferase 3 n=2 Tax=Gasterosteus aculeatus aculeatus TaxID=481459 RepID=A0AAQ4RV34_GASAC|nr:tRNA (cytosine(34)-C(5))-methyltransferase, mitochondrial isoform X1 [Gasterosteus aculeatus aculeatus]